MVTWEPDGTNREMEDWVLVVLMARTKLEQMDLVGEDGAEDERRSYCDG